MKKSVIIVISGIILVILAILFFMPKEDEIPVDDDNGQVVVPNPIIPEGDNNDDDNNNNDDSDDNNDDERQESEELPGATPTDISKAILEPGSETEEKFLTKTQKEELYSPGLNSREPEEREVKNYMISWSQESFDEVIPKMPESAPVYLLDRPEDNTVYDVIKELGDYMGLSGAVIRMNPQSFALANIQTGQYFMTFDMYHLLFAADNLEVLAENGVEDTLRSWGLLNYPYTIEEKEDNNGDTWNVITPDLDLPVITMEEDVSATFTPDTLGEIHVKTEGDYITHIISRFPNIKEKEELSLVTAEDISEILSSGEFELGDVELQYPGALSVEQRRSFYDVVDRERISIDEAEATRMECGYLLEDQRNVQVLLSPVCIAQGNGKVNDYSVFFKVLFPAVQ